MSETEDQQRLTGYVEIWKRACDDVVALGRSLDVDDHHRATDLDGWDVQDNLAHLAHLEAVLAGAPEETIDVAASPRLRSASALYTEQGVLARRGRCWDELVAELDAATTRRYDALRASPPTSGADAPPRTPGSVPWDNETLLANRPLDVWMHEQDIRRAIGRPGGYDSPAATHTIRRLGAGLPMVWGRRVAPPPGTSVVVEIAGSGSQTGAVVGSDGRARAEIAERPDLRVVITAEDFVVLFGGRRTADRTHAVVEGDHELGARLLASLAVTP